MNKNIIKTQIVVGKENIDKEELLQVFDENKNMLDESIARNLKTTLTNGKHFMVILIFIENDNKYLIQKVSPEKGSVYATTGGHVTFKDDGFITCKKEIKEELGINLLDNEIKYIGTIDEKNLFIEVYYSNKKINIDDLNLQAEEVESVNWLSKEEIMKLIAHNNFRKSNIKAFNMLLEYQENNK